MNGLPPAAKKVYIFNQSKNLLEGQLDSIISRAVEHIMMLVFYDAGLTLTWQLPLDDAQQKQNFEKRMCRSSVKENWKETFWLKSQ